MMRQEHRQRIADSQIPCINPIIYQLGVKYTHRLQNKLGKVSTSQWESALGNGSKSKNTFVADYKDSQQAVAVSIDVMMCRD